MHSGFLAGEVLKRHAREMGLATAGTDISGADKDYEFDVADVWNVELFQPPTAQLSAHGVVPLGLLPITVPIGSATLSHMSSYEALNVELFQPPTAQPSAHGIVPLGLLPITVLIGSATLSHVSSHEALEDIETGESLPPTVTFDQLSDDLPEIREERAEINSRLEEAKSDLSPEIFNRLKERFDFLFEPDEGDQVRISPGSVRQFLRFLKQDRKLRCPSIVITDRRNVKAIWRASEKEIFWIEFEPNGDVTYLAFYPNEQRSDGVERVSALSTVDDVLSRAKSTGALKWMRS